MSKIPAALAMYDPAKIEAKIAIAAAKPDYPGETEAYFSLWLLLTDRHVSRKIGLGIYDIEDAPYRDYFDDGLSPKEAAQCALEESDMYSAFFE